MSGQASSSAEKKLLLTKCNCSIFPRGRSSYALRFFDADAVILLRLRCAATCSKPLGRQRFVLDSTLGHGWLGFLGKHACFPSTARQANRARMLSARRLHLPPESSLP